MLWQYEPGRSTTCRAHILGAAIRILWHSNAPWAPSGYGQQTCLWVPRLAALGHEIAISAFHGHQGAPTEWRGHRVYGAGLHPYGGDIVGLHARHFKADLVIAHMDDWALPFETLKGIPFACWMPVDTWPLSQLSYNSLTASKAWPVAISKFGAVMLSEAGFAPLYVPHGIDTQVFRPPDDRQALREAMGVDDRFVILMVAANLDKARKGYAEQFAAFSRFHDKHKDALLVVHTVRHTAGGLNLPEMAALMAIPQHAIRFSDQYLTTAGLVEPEMMRGTFGMADLYSGCSLAEGFGLPILEALACGTPAAVTSGSAMPEVAGPAGWKVKSEQYWAAGHGAWWQKPLIAEIVKAYEAAYSRGASYQAKKKAAREHALTYDVDRVLGDFWEPAMKELEKRVGSFR